MNDSRSGGGVSRRAEELPSFIAMDVLEAAQALERQGRRIIHLEVGEPDFDTPLAVKRAAAEALEENDTHYTHSLGLLELRLAIAAYYRERYGVELEPDRIIVTSGSSPALFLAFAALIDPGDEVLLTDPHYACYPQFISMAGGRRSTCRCAKRRPSSSCPRRWSSTSAPKQRRSS